MKFSHILCFVAVSTTSAFTFVNHVTLRSSRSASFVQMSDDVTEKAPDGAKVCLVTGSSRGVYNVTSF